MNALVTGAGGGIGGEVVSQLLRDGAGVVAQYHTHRRPDSRAGLVPSVGDLLDPEYQLELRRAIEDARIDSVIAAHGVDGSGRLEDLEDEHVERIMLVNALSVAVLFELSLPVLRSTKGSFVVVASQAGLNAEAANAAYCASKFAIVGWVQRLAAMVVDTGVRVRALCPGCTDTPLLSTANERFAVAQGVSATALIQDRRSRIPIKRFAAVSETAAAALYLAAPRRNRPTVLAATGGEVLQ